MWGFSSMAQGNAIANMISKPETTLIDVLEESTLSSAIRNPSPPIISFFIDKTADLFDWVLKDVHSDHPRYIKIQRNALTVLASPNPNLQKQFSKNESFALNIKSFMELETFQERLCGNFSKVVETFSRSNSIGEEFLRSFPNLSKFLISHLNILGFLELFVNLTLDCENHFVLTPDLLSLLAQQCAGPQGNFPVLAISSIIKQKHEGFMLFNKPEFLLNLIEAAADPATSPLTLASILSLVLFIFYKMTFKQKPESALIAQAQELQRTLAPASAKFNLETRPYDYVTPYLMIIFNYLNSSLIKLFLENTNNSMLGTAIQTVIPLIPKEQIAALVQESNLISQILEIYSVNNFENAGKCPKQVQTSGALGSITDSLIKLNLFPELNILIAEDHPFLKHFHLREADYGGERVHSPSDDSSDGGPVGETEAFVEPSHNLFSDSDEEESSSESSSDEGGGNGWLQDSDSESSDDSLDGNLNSPPGSPPFNPNSDSFGLPAFDGEETNFHKLPPPPPFIPDDEDDEIVPNTGKLNLPPPLELDELPPPPATEKMNINLPPPPFPLDISVENTFQPPMFGGNLPPPFDPDNLLPPPRDISGNLPIPPPFVSDNQKNDESAKIEPPPPFHPSPSDSDDE